MTSPAPNTLAIVGAGPIGLEAAARALELGLDVHVFERGEPGDHVAAWGHVRMFTPWSANVGPAAERLLARGGWTRPDPGACPTGAEFLDAYLRPLAAAPGLRERVHAHAQVVHVGRRGVLPQAVEGREAAPFRLVVRDAGGRESVLHAARLVDASGTYGCPNWAGTGGVPARGETYLAPQMGHHCDDVAGLRRDRHAGRRTLVIGGGASAATTVTALAALAAEVPGTTVAWARRSASGPLAGEVANDPLAGRAALFAAAHALEAGSDPAVTCLAGAEVEGFEYNSATHRYRVTFTLPAGTRVEEADEVVINTGYAPDESMLRALQVRLDPATHAVTGTGGGAARWAHPEPGLWILGAKSWGRDGSFRLADGHAQVGDVLR